MGRTELSDSACPGLWLRVTASGVKSFAIRYRLNGQPLRYTLGKHPAVSLKQARLDAQERLSQIRKGNDPRFEKSDAKAFRLLDIDIASSFYLEQLGKSTRGRKLKASHISEVGRRFKASIIPELKSRPLTSIDSATIIKLLDQIERRAPRVAAHVYYDLRAFFRWALKEQAVPVSPMEGIEPPRKPESRERVLTPHEISQIWGTCMARPTTYHIIIMLLILTGQRRNEVAEAVWKEFDLSEAVWTIPKHRTKNSRQHRVPLSPLAVRILRQWRLVTRQTNNFCEQRLLFPSSGATGAFSGWSKSKKRLDAASGTTGWTVHDLRRTLATRMAEAKVLPHVIERILNHSSGTMSSIAKVYNRATYEAEMREGLENWAKLISATQDTAGLDSWAAARSPL